MYTQIQHFTPKIMSTSQDFQQNTDIKDNSPQPDSVIDQENAKILKVIGTDGDEDHKDELLLDEITKKSEEATGSSRNTQEKEIGENDDGFKTPTSPSHKIPSPVQCPAAPRKPLPPKLKRKASSPAACRRLQFDEPEDVESIFRALSDVEETKTKKARRKEED